jgi:hypothetical protein
MRVNGRCGLRKTRLSVRVVLLIVACLSLPLCCLPICALVPSYPMFWGHFSVLNDSDETLYVTPIGGRSGQRRVLLAHFSRFPYAPILKRADVRLEPGESVRIYCRVFAEPVWALTAIVVRDERREYRQLEIEDQATSLLWASAEPVYRIESFGELESVGPDILEIARKAGRLHVAAWAVTGAGLVPVVLFGAWLLLVRQARARI